MTDVTLSHATLAKATDISNKGVISQDTGGITKFSKMENLEKVMKVELLLLEFLGTENPKEIVIFLRFPLHCYKNAEKILKLLHFL